jgi:Xaa-Pro aminopeptidase
MISKKKTESIRKACSVGDEIFSLILKNIKSKSLKTEKDIDNFIRREARKRKLKISFPPVVANAANAAEIHHKPKKTKFKKGFLVLDFGVKVSGFCSDMTRTVFIGKAAPKERKIYNTLLSVQKSAIKKAKPRVECFEIDCFVRKKLKSLREYFLHSLGHGVGKKIHELPNLSPRSCNVLKKGDIITIEPGIYIKKKLGIRIEDTIIVKKNPEILTKSPKRLIEIK